MYPHPHHMMGHWHRGPSRILWFMVGAGVATWFIHAKEANRRQWGFCHRPAISPHAQAGEAAPEGAAPASWSVRDIPRTINNVPQADWDWNSAPNRPGSNRQWPWQGEKAAAMSRDANDVMTELTESTLDSVLSTAQALKAKLAEHRAERDRQQKDFAKQQEEASRNPPRIV